MGNLHYKTFHDIIENQSNIEASIPTEKQDVEENICGVWRVFFPSNSSDFTARSCANTIRHISEVELCIILTTLEKFLFWNLSFNH